MKSLSMNSKEIFLGRQPILNDRQNLVAYELLFRSSATLNAAVIQDIPAASVDVILNSLYDFGGMDVLGRQKGFINVETKVLMTETIELLPKERVVLEILESVEITSEVIKRCQDLKKMGFTLAVDDLPASSVRSMITTVSLNSSMSSRLTSLK